MASSFPRRRKNQCDDSVGKVVRIETLSLTTAATIKCHRDSLESSNCDEGDDSGTEPWSGSCSSDSLSENSDCHVDQNDSGCDENIFHDTEFDVVLVDDDECDQNSADLCDVSQKVMKNSEISVHESNGLQTKERRKNICTLKVH